MPAAPESSSSDAWRGHERGTPEFGAVRLALLFAGIVTFAQLYAPQAVLPQISSEFAIDASRAALMVSLATLGVALSTIPWALLADRTGRVRVMTWSVTSATLLGLVTTAAGSFELAAAIRFVEGLALGGVPAVAIAYLNEEVTRRAAPVVAGTFVAGNTLGGLAGRLIAAPVAELFGWRIGILAVSLVAVAATIAFIATVPPARGFLPPRHGSTTLRDSAQATLRHCLEHLRTPALLGVYAQPALLMGGFVAVYNFLSYRLLAAPFNLPASIVGLAFLAYLTGALTSPIAGGLAARFPRRRVLLACSSVMLLGVIITFAQPLWAILLGLLILTAGFFAAHSVATGIAGSLPRRGRAQSSALYNLSYYAGSSVFGLLGGHLYEAFGWPGTAWLVTGLIVAAMTIARVLIPSLAPPGPEGS